MKNREFMMLQLFAAGDNNDMPVRSYQLEFKSLLQAVFKKDVLFRGFFSAANLRHWMESEKMKQPFM